MIVVDASVLANALADDGEDGALARAALRSSGGLTAPDLVDVETSSVLRKRWLRGDLDDDRIETAIGHLERLDLERVPTLRLLRRALALRRNVTAYDGCYVALAEVLGCRLVTGDARLAAAAAGVCAVQALSTTTTR
ncbi:type II toxin-antitoxin system VapC family toxin [Pseudokineococcus marinus]|uniref:Ribonuclease VapC n=1 Tax=Pseudokineococcus marinus TaxID=351215 RepID=A0A849BVF8_9ACTN|nr:type II toxin-antitoxin system VapC family toxin [Pseudokineococcus marinus]NNH21548.1 type II toxin-antitoxin system VapC family toxin [Pseudokineococcus marinus]